MKYIIANWKMNMDQTAVVSWIETFRKDTSIIETLETNIKVIVAPSLPYLAECSSLKPLGIKLSGQDVSFKNKGAHTGDVGTFQLKDFCEYCIIGHSERGETTSEVLKKRDQCLQSCITPIICVTDAQKAEQVAIEGTIIAWEDPTNISKDNVYNQKDPNEITKGIQQIKQLLPPNVPLVYGGSVNRQNIANLAKITELDGVLSGQASTEVGHFIEIIKCFN